MPRLLDCISTTFDVTLVIIAVLICLLGALSSVVAAARARSARKLSVWSSLLAICSASTIWATHFVAMLAYRPAITTTYDAIDTAASYGIGLMVSGGALVAAATTRQRRNWPLHGVLFGIGVAALHYLGMAALAVPGRLVFDPGWVGGSIILSCVLGMVTVPTLFGARSTLARGLAVALISATVLGLHFTGMAAVSVVLIPNTPLPDTGLTRSELASAATAAALSIVVITLLGASVADRIVRATANEAARFRTLADSSTEAVIIHRDGDVIDTNVAARRLFDLAEDDAVTVASLFPAGQLPSTASDSGETRMLRRDGSEVAVEICRGPILAADGSAAELLAVRDLTARKFAEATLAKALADANRLRDLIPMCAWCKKIRHETGYWRAVDEYLSQTTGQDITHGVCPECMERLRADLIGSKA